MNLFKSVTPVALIAGSLISTQALAQADSNISQKHFSHSGNVSYNHVGLQYITQDWQDCNQDGLNFYGSMGFSERLFVIGSVADVDGDSCGSTSLSAGLGYHMPMNDTFDFYGTLSLVQIDWDGGDDTGIAAAGGIRGFLSERLESRLALEHQTTDDGETTIGGGIAYWFSNSWTATLDASIGGDTTTMLAGARYTF